MSSLPQMDVCHGHAKAAAAAAAAARRTVSSDECGKGSALFLYFRSALRMREAASAPTKLNGVTSDAVGGFTILKATRLPSQYTTHLSTVTAVRPRLVEFLFTKHSKPQRIGKGECVVLY